jgi:hypothetical protein
MNKAKVQRRIMITAAGLVLLSIVLMVITLPRILHDTSAGANPESAAKAVVIVMVLHVLAIVGFLSILRVNKRDGKINKAGCIVLGVALLLLGFVVMDGASAFLDRILFVSILLFISAFCDIVAALITFIALFLKPKKSNEID